MGTEVQAQAPRGASQAQLPAGPAEEARWSTGSQANGSSALLTAQARGP